MCRKQWHRSIIKQYLLSVHHKISHRMFLQSINKYIPFAAIIMLASCADKKPPAPQAPPPAKVTVQQVSLSDAIYYDEYPATVTPLNQIELRPQVGGFITGVYFKDGDRVKKGQ